MAFPVWHFIGIGSGLIIAVVSVLHVFVAQFAVGGGIYLVWMEGKAHRETPRNCCCGWNAIRISSCW